MKNPFQVIHSPLDSWRKKFHVALVRPELGANVGAAARAIMNMGIRGELFIVGNPAVVNSDCRRLSKHAWTKVENAIHVPTLADALTGLPGNLSIATTARSGSAHRPHPLRCDEAAIQATEKLMAGDVKDVVLVFGPESDGLNNEEVSLCDWITTIPSNNDYRSLNLGQAVLILCYEANRCLMREWPAFEGETVSQRQRLTTHFLKLAEECAFVLPGDPFKMKPRLERIFSQLPPFLEGASTLHGLIDQAIRSVRRGSPDVKGRYRHVAEVGNKEGSNDGKR